MTPGEHVDRANYVMDNDIKPRLQEGEGAVLVTFQADRPGIVTYCGSCSEEQIYSVLRSVVNKLEIDQNRKMQSTWSFTK